MSTTSTTQTVPEAPVVQNIPFNFSTFQPTYIIILILCFLVLFILLILLWQISFPKFWSGMISTPLFKRR